MGLKTLKSLKHKKKSNIDNFDYILFSVIIILLSFGVIMVYSASFYQAMTKENNGMYFFIRQGLFAIIGCIAMWIISRIDYGRWRKYMPIILGISALCLLFILVAPYIGLKSMLHTANGATRWINLGFTTFQPSELAKYAIVLYLAVALANKGDKIKSIRKGLIPTLGVAALFSGLVLAQDNLSIASVILIVSIAMVFAAGAKMKHMFGIAGLGVAAMTAGMVFEPYRMLRFTSFLDPWKDPMKSGYQLIQSFYSLGAGGVVGLGLGKSRQKTMYMPEPHNDFIFSIIGEELGLIGCTFVIALFLMFIYRGVMIAIAAKDVYGTLLAIGITAVIAVQAIINIAVVTGSMPVTGVPLPFISYGGTSLFINLCAMGILLNISRQSKKTI